MNPPPPPPPRPLTVKSDSFLLQLDGKHEDCRTKNKSFKIIIVFTKGVIEIEFWSIALYGVVVIFYHGRYRYHVIIQVSGLVRIQKFNRDGKKGFSPPPPIATYFYWNKFLICVCIFRFRRDGSAGVVPPPLLSENSTNKGYLAIYLISTYSTPPFLHRNRCCEPPPLPRKPLTITIWT